MSMLDCGFNMYDIDVMLITDSILETKKVELGNIEEVDIVLMKVF